MRNKDRIGNIEASLAALIIRFERLENWDHVNLRERVTELEGELKEVRKGRLKRFLGWIASADWVMIILHIGLGLIMALAIGFLGIMIKLLINEIL